jgi:dipeptidyl aminopeptidase/acylaminoacyl peptidase
MKYLRPLFTTLLVFQVLCLFSQKKPLDHSVYDGWQHIGEKLISADGRWVVYTVEPQQGDGLLVIRSNDGVYSKSIARGYNALITEDSRFLVFRVKPLFKDTREARIRKKKPEDFPKDSFAIVELGKEEIYRTAAVKSYKTPARSSGWVAFQREKITTSSKKGVPGDRRADSLQNVIDSLKRLINEQPVKKKKGKRDEDGIDDEEGFDDAIDAEGEEGTADAGTELVLLSLYTGKEEVFDHALDYLFSETGGKLVIRQAKDLSDSLKRPRVIVYDLENNRAVTVMRGGNDFRNFAFSKDGSKLAFVAERDSKPKDPLRYFKLWYYQHGWDTAVAVADRYSIGMPLGNTVSEFGNLSFSRSGDRLFFGTAPNPLPEDSTIIEAETPKLDLWHYNDEYLQTVQTLPARLRTARQQNYLAVYQTPNGTIQQLGCREIPQVVITNEGDGPVFAGITDAGKRIESQWEGTTLKDIYAINPNTGEHKLIAKDVAGNIYPSAAGTTVAWYDRRQKKYFAWQEGESRNISGKTGVALYNEEHDAPGLANNYGVMGWHEGDSALYVYDMYDIWKLDTRSLKNPVNISRGLGRKEKVELRYLELNPDKRFFRHGDLLLFRTANRVDKKRGLRIFSTDGHRHAIAAAEQDMQFSEIRAAKSDLASLVFLKENFNRSPDIYVGRFSRDPSVEHHDLSGRIPVEMKELKLSGINPQQADYIWGNAELVKWKAYDGKDAMGIVYKPENFDPKKKYPMIVYFYEKLSQDLFDYKEPAPIRSAINIPFFVSRGYILFLPDISYENGYPGRSAYNYIVSGSRALVKKGFVDSNRIAIQGHSWGGYQAAQLATMTTLFKAVWAGAPVANMTSAYGGIRWETGVSRQFQYERTQSRLGVTPWENLGLYIENSPLFHLDKVKAPMVIMHNDADGAVPWYQGIELFTALRRLGKKVWMLNYNGQGHGLTQRQDMRDYHIRMQQFFDWILKDEPPARWITDGIPATEKGRDLGY